MSTRHLLSDHADAPQVRRGRPSRPSVGVVVPTLNEARNLREVLPSLEAVRPDEVVVVDGGSTDGTAEVAHEVMPGAEVVEQHRSGKGNALVTGLHALHTDIAVTFDADGSADPAEIPDFVSALVEGADMAKGSRYLPGGGSEDLTRIRSLGNLGLTGVFNVSFHRDFTDLCYGYNAFWLDVLPRLGLPDPDADAPADGQVVWGDGFEIETLFACRFAAAGADIAEVPSVEHDRLHGTSNLSAIPDGWRVLTTIGRERARSRRRTPAPAPRHLRAAS